MLVRSFNFSVGVRNIAESPNEFFTQFVIFFKQILAVLVKQSLKLRALCQKLCQDFFSLIRNINVVHFLPPKIKSARPKPRTKNANSESLNQLEYDRANLLSTSGICIFIKSVCRKHKKGYSTPLETKKLFKNILSWFSILIISQKKTNINIFYKKGN